MNGFDSNQIAKMMKMLEQFKNLSAIKNDKDGLYNLIKTLNPQSAQMLTLLEQTKNGDISSVLPYLLTFNNNRQRNSQREKEQEKKVSVQTKTQSFGLKPIANIATPEILKDIINLLD